jgi:ABC-2 type transport system ATP-binding protein
VLPADGGVILQDGRPLSDSERRAALFYLPDGISPWPHETVAWALDFIDGFFGGRSGARDAAVESLDLGALLRSRIGTLSKGQRKRFLLALGLLAPQPVLLADEPFDGLDLRQTRDAARALGSVAERGRTLFLSIHQVSEAMRVCDRFVLLSGGRVRGEGTVEELSPQSRDLEEAFLALT